MISIKMFEKFQYPNNLGYILFIFGMFASKGFPVFKINRYLDIYNRNTSLKLRGGVTNMSMKTTTSASSITSSSSDKTNTTLYNESKTFTPEALKRAHENSLELYNRFRNSKDNYISVHLNRALDILTDALRLYGPYQLFSSYNGGKDAVVIMHLLRAVTAKYSEDKGEIVQPQFVYFAIKDEFPEVIEHIKESEEQYCLSLIRYNCAISQGLTEHIKQMDSRSTPAFVLGTRQSDPNCGTQQAFAPSSWNPPFMRVNPILTWEYGHVWHFLRTFNLPYCSLYDRGFTSLGKITDTYPNPALRRKHLNSTADFFNESTISSKQYEESLYWPAYMLADWSLERAGRGVNTKGTNNNTNTNTEGKETQNVTNDSYKISPEKEVTTAGMIVIGDEILNGMTTEVNMIVVCNCLKTIGIPLHRVAIVLDDIDEIVEEVRKMSQKYDIVITSGGIGPTHDDVTIKAVAKALGQELKLNDEMLSHLLRVRSQGSMTDSTRMFTENIDIDEDMKKMAMLPENSKLLFAPAAVSSSEGSSSPGSSAASPRDQVTVAALAVTRYQDTNSSNSTDLLGLRAKFRSATSSSNSSINPIEWPVLQCENIFVLPGIPQFFEKKMKTISKHFLKMRQLRHTKKIILNVEESTIVRILDELVDKFSPGVKFGSYPFVDHPEFKTIITVESESVVAVDRAVERMLEALPESAVLRVERVENLSKLDL